MGQYWRAGILDRKTHKPWAIGISYDYDHCGAKIGEHSYLHNSFVTAVLQYMFLYGPMRLVWVGDGAEGKETGHWNNPDWLMTHQSVKIRQAFINNVWDDETRIIQPLSPHLPSYETIVRRENDGWQWEPRWIHNITKDQWIDLQEYESQHVRCSENLHMHPIPLLTAVGSVGWDWRSPTYPFIGSWAGDVLEVYMKSDEDELQQELTGKNVSWLHLTWDQEV